jgi:hypothetical protein
MIAVSVIFDYNGNKKELLASSVEGQNIIGYRLNGNGSAPRVVLELLCEVEPLWKTPIFRFILGILVWLS